MLFLTVATRQGPPRLPLGRTAPPPGVARRPRSSPAFECRNSLRWCQTLLPTGASFTLPARSSGANRGQWSTVYLRHPDSSGRRKQEHGRDCRPAGKNVGAPPYLCLCGPESSCLAIVRARMALTCHPGNSARADPGWVTAAANHRSLIHPLLGSRPSLATARGGVRPGRACVYRPSAGSVA